MRQYIYSLMTDKRNGFVASIMKGTLSVISFFYGLIIKIIRPIRMATAKKLPCKVISVGNLTLGGTGKTPTACMLANFLKKEGRRPCVLIRGYGEDEWKMLKNLLGDIPVIVGRDRFRSGIKALGEFGADTLILDDGFQHWALRRDLDLVLMDSSGPLGNGRLFPRGLLREDVKGLKRADMIVLTKTDMGRPRGGVARAMGMIKKNAPDAVVLESVHNPLKFYDLADKSESALSSVKGKSICAVSSIVNTEYFEFTLNKLGANITARFHYPDHYNYKTMDLELIFDKCGKQNIETIVTTEKDAIKLSTVIARRDCLPKAGEPKQSQKEIASRTQPVASPSQIASPRLARLAMTGEAIARNDRVRVKVLQVESRITNGEEILHERLRGLYRG